LKDPSKQVLKFELYDKDKYVFLFAVIPRFANLFTRFTNGKDSLGEARFLDIPKLYKGIAEEAWIPIILKGKIEGRLHLTLTAKNFGLPAPRTNQ